MPMALTAWVFLLLLARVATKRIHVSQQIVRHASPERQQQQQPEPLPLKSPIPEQVAGPPQSSSRPIEHFWARRGGNQRTNNDVPWTAPSNLSVTPSWTWSNPLGEQVRHSPLIDRNFDVYIMTSLRIRKFHGRTGAQLWMWESPWATEPTPTFEIGTCPVLDGDALLAVVPGPSSIVVYSLSLRTGLVNWEHEHAVKQGSDASGMLAQNGTLVFGIRNELHPLDKKDSFNRKVLAVDTSDGSRRWDFEPDGIVWNFAPSSPGDGTLLFGSACGTAYKLDFGGRLLWKSSAGGLDLPTVCSTGGGSLGPDGVFYISWSYGSLTYLPGNFVAAIDSNGVQLWRKTIFFGDGGAQYPAVGKLGGDGPLAVVVAVGDQNLVLGQPAAGAHTPLRNAVVALDAMTGAELWLSEETPWPHTEAAGDELSSLIPRMFAHPNLNPVCWPDPQGIPLITGDGTVYASSSHSGNLRSIRTTVEAGPIPMVKATEESTFRPGIAFLNSPSTAPGMLVASPCWGPTFVFLSEE